MVNIETVADLIKALQELPQDAIVGHYHECSCGKDFDNDVKLNYVPADEEGETGTVWIEAICSW